KLNDKQRDLLMKLVRSYINRWPEEVAAARRKTLPAGGGEQIHLAYFGGPEPGQGYTYPGPGPPWATAVINTQQKGAKKEAHRIHSDYRRIEGDFGIKK